MAAGLEPAVMIKANGGMKIEEIIHNEPPRLLILYDQGQEEITRVVADVLGYTYSRAESLDAVRGWSDEVVVGMENVFATELESLRKLDRTLITTHCVDGNDGRDEALTAFCDYEYLYTSGTPLRRDLARFLGFVLGQIKPHDDLKRKQRTTLLSTTFPDIRGALPNLDILSVGADSVELRVDLLRDPATDDDFGAVPGLKYVGEQVMLLRQRTELPIIFTTRCTRENGLFPMKDPGLFYTYLRKAIQWGCEYVDVELWLPEEIRRQLAAEKGHSKIISAWHDFSGMFKWTSPDAQRLFKEGAVYGDIVKMIALVHNMEDNYELEYFRSIRQSVRSNPPFSGLNMGTIGQLSRTLNKVFTPITHPLMPLVAAPGQLSAAEINSMLHSMGQMPRMDMYAIGHVRSNGLATFMAKCLNELSQPHQLLSVERSPTGSIEPFLSRHQFGGAYINPPLPVEDAPYLPTLTEAASAIGQVDTIAVRAINNGRAMVADNVTWKGIRATLTKEYVPSAYAGRAALVFGNSKAQSAAAIYALGSLDIGIVYTIGFAAKGSFKCETEQLCGVEDLRKVEAPFAIISALPAEKSFAVSPILKHYSSGTRTPSARSGKIFVDLSNGIKGHGDSVSIAASLGWVASSIADVNAWTIVETLRLLIGHPYDLGQPCHVASEGERWKGCTQPCAQNVGRACQRHDIELQFTLALGCDEPTTDWHRSTSDQEIKCNRLKPSCEACQVFNCPCVYDAIPKKRGPKTDVLESLLKRVNGLEKRLKEEQKTNPSSSPEEDDPTAPTRGTRESSDTRPRENTAHSASPEQQEMVDSRPQQMNTTHVEPVPPMNEAFAFTDALLDTFFARVHNKPYYILDETATRQRLRDGRLPPFLINAVHAVSIRYVPQLCGGHAGAIRSSHDYVTRSRAEIDVDEPSIDNLQALLLLAMANFQNGRGKRCYMVLTHAVSMAFALNLHRELPAELRIANSEREGRRKLFWTCYLMDRFTVSGSKRPSLISDESIHLRLPGWQQQGSQTWVEGSFFPNGSSLPHASGISHAAQSSGTMLVEIVRVLGVTNRYLGAGGVKGDSHFPWHAQSTLSRIRSDLDYWAAATQDVFTSIDTLFGSQDTSTLVLSKLIYHLIHCLIYRPFLPIDLAELSGTSQNQSWQIEATNLCFLHANAIAELVEIGKNTALLDWPSFVGYCICTAGTIHVHGAHYMAYREGDAFCHSSEFLSREMAQLLELRSIWTGVQHQRDTLQLVYASHAQLVKSLSSNPMRFSPVFQMEDFFDRYPGSYIDGAHVAFSDVLVDPSYESLPTFDPWQGSGENWAAPVWSENVSFTPMIPSQTPLQSHHPNAIRRPKKRRSTTGSQPYPTPPRADTTQQATIEEEQAVEEHVPQIEVTENVTVSEQHEHHPESEHNPMLFSGTFTPNFGFSPMPSTMHAHHMPDGQQVANPEHHPGPSSGGSASADSHNLEPENDPFLSLLEQLAGNDSSGLAEHGEFDFFLGGNV
ncbi:Pentafunctional AROM polypeptide [Fulvia fulva]|uniref:Pentafunctional AROM polypeptide n=1 Tax=Passalora fulva TaxID=5499 RepID=A0A9Q8PLQ7_PASFU|nr:Pentafunctional AROM polypeptide [Fulvia fulva]KAK4610622.1 Pentafunctional AROM polypeptide [Fulvia fulva]UJO24694.1 Pentafunctional AROM polypeptide [Fulvia fulva]WPV22245.1 Pentafunctional AROM polypeptide [Fulvia fulva]WPV37243.1 Pentafunctional AROM polypeptide [Fulvia fulva]